MPSAPSPPPPMLATLGMFILDTFSFLDPVTSQPLGDHGLGVQLGGGGLYFCIGARLFLSPAQMQMIIDTGRDFTPAIRSSLELFDRVATPDDANEGVGGGASMWRFRPRDGLTTRAVNVYKGEHRSFGYLTPKVRLEVADLLSASPCSPARLPQWIHIICSPQRAADIIRHIDAHLASSVKADEAFPNIVYEPIPDSCVAENLDNCLALLPRLAVFSPNHEEAASLLGRTDEWQRVSSLSATAQQVAWIEDKLASGFVEASRRRPGQAQGALPLICVRSGKLGCVVGRQEVGFQHVPAFHFPDVPATHVCSSEKVVDVTGAGNSFLGGLTAYLVANEDRLRTDTEPDQVAEQCKQAAVHGAVAASLIVEQLGLPSFEIDSPPDQGPRGMWNGSTTQSRLDLLRARMKPPATVASTRA
ncbi:hypothetical protein ACQY0O_001601 [Thecaphora frezii]